MAGQLSWPANSPLHETLGNTWCTDLLLGCEMYKFAEKYSKSLWGGTPSSHHLSTSRRLEGFQGKTKQEADHFHGADRSLSIRLLGSHCVSELILRETLSLINWGSAKRITPTASPGRATWVTTKPASRGLTPLHDSRTQFLTLNLLFPGYPTSVVQWTGPRSPHLPLSWLSCFC